MNQKEEQILRESIRQMIHLVKEKRAKEQEMQETKLRGIIRGLAKVEHTKLDEEQKLRNIIGDLISVELMNLTESGLPDDKPAPNKSTGINVLEDLLKKIIPVLEIDYRQMTTSPEQRKSFRAHIVNAVVTTLTPVEVNTEAGEEEAELDEAVDVDIVDDKFIDIRSDAEKAAEEEEEEEADPVDDFGTGLEGEDETGRNMAFQSFAKVEGNIVDSYELLSNPEDQELFYDYLIANLKLYFDKFEDELATNVEEPTNQAYDDAKAGEEASVDDVDVGTEEEEFALEETIVWDIPTQG